MRTHKAVPVSMTEGMLALVNARAKSLGLSRSGYIQQLMRADLGMPSTNMLPDSTTLRETGTNYGSGPPQPPPDKKLRNAIASASVSTSYFVVTRKG